MYTDNCNAQNKNRLLFCALIRTVNDMRIRANSITLKYLESGHTFMSCDSIHASIQTKVRKAENICDLKRLISSSRKRLETLELSEKDFYNFDMSEASGMKGVSNIRKIQFWRGHFTAFVKRSFDENSYDETEVFKRGINPKPDIASDNPLDLVDRQEEK